MQDICTGKLSAFLSGSPSLYTYKQGGISLKYLVVSYEISTAERIVLILLLTIDLKP